jgi:hypothetical protein
LAASTLLGFPMEVFSFETFVAELSTDLDECICSLGFIWWISVYMEAWVQQDFDKSSIYDSVNLISRTELCLIEL